MNRVEYMYALTQKLKRLPQEDFDNAMEYFYEYFEEAGPEGEQQAIEDLGTPESAADQIICNLAIQNANEPGKTVKRSFSAVWIAILAIFAAPIGLPLAFAGVVLALSLVLVLVCLIASLFLAALSLTVCAVLGCLGGVYFLFVSPLNGLTVLGAGILCLGLSIYAVYGSIIFCKWSLNKTIVLFSKFIKGGKKHAKVK